MYLGSRRPLVIIVGGLDESRRVQSLENRTDYAGTVDRPQVWLARMPYGAEGTVLPTHDRERDVPSRADSGKP